MSECNCESIIIKMTPEGEDGIGIVSIELVSTVGVIKTYRITLTNGTFFDFDVSDGSSIASIEKTSTEGLVDTYTITLTDGSTTTFTVTNGAQGERGPAGPQGPEGPAGATGNGIASITLYSESGLQKTYRITFTNGQHFDFVVTDGKDGVDGKDGKDGQDGAQGPAGNGIASITKTGSTGLVDHYRITFTDGTHFDYDVTNGEGSGGGTWGSITGTLSDQTDLQNALDNKADVIFSSASGSIASFSDGAPYPVTALTVGVEPVQDLHGQDAPWPAGGGKNLLNPSISAYTLIGGNYRFLKGVVPSGQTAIMSFTDKDTSVDISGCYIGFVYEDLSETQSAPRESRWCLANGNIQSNKGNTSTTSSYLCENVFIYPQSEDVFNRIFARFNVQVELGSSASSFAPYENICPISGHTETTVTRTGKNLFDPNSSEHWYIDSNNTKSYSDNARTAIVPCTQGDEFTISCERSSSGPIIYIAFADVSGNILSRQGTSSSTTITKTAPANSAFCYAGDSDMSKTAWCQVDLGYTASPYEAYQGTSVTIDLGSTVYGGTLDVVGRRLTVDRAMRVFSGDSAETWEIRGGSSVYGYFGYKIGDINTIVNHDALSNQFALVNIASNTTDVGVDTINSSAFSGAFINVRPPNVVSMTVSDWKTYLATNNLQVVYELATPTVIENLTEAQISTLLGNNVIWADTGDIQNVQYRADTKAYIDKVVSQTALTTRAMIADSATADGKAPKSLASGDLIIVGDELRKCTSNIGSGSAITASNSTVATLADVIKALQ